MLGAATKMPRTEKATTHPIQFSYSRRVEAPSEVKPWVRHTLPLA